ncbi:alpha/beta hydrolase [Dyadobacter sp. CY312]|uniref:alpha/beta hydrolase n=1 Tax=Dyadobacter sp. CY312 TaxID=2907303 RepID=UPI001F1A39C4|nr:alpha/beta hydrolase-fold protein [Dyadobacter sp. CY312]MCE7039251.1 esterase family protein [Dyadobacter sp. CY312]
MGKLQISVKVDSLSELVQIDTNKYQFVVKFFDLQDQPLNHSSIPNVSTHQVTTTSNEFSFEILGITNANALTAKAKIYRDNDTNCCVSSKVFVTPTGGGGNPENGIFELLMNTTGNGLDPNTPSGLMESWVERIEAFQYDWGWGITGISVCIQWYLYEPTEGNYRNDIIQKNIDFCNERGLSLSYKFWALRRDDDPMIHEDEKQRGALGDKLATGPSISQEISPSYGCDRTNAIIANTAKALATKLATYSRAGHLILAGGHTEELVYAAPNNGQGANSQMTDLSPDSLTRFNAWVAARGLTTPGHPPTINGIPWPHPDFNHPLGLEFGRFLTYSMRKYFDNFANAVRSVSNLKVLYYYAAFDGGQMPSTNNPNFNFIAANSDGMYGSAGEGIYAHKEKLMVNAINLGTFPNGHSIAELDANDLDTSFFDDPRIPSQDRPLDLNLMKSTMTDLYNRGCHSIDFAMAFFPAEIAKMRNHLQDLHQTHIGKPYVRPVINSANTLTVDVVPDYRTGDSYLWNIDPWTKYVKITDDDFFGGVTPFVEGTSTPARFENFNLGGRIGEVWLPANYSNTKEYAVVYANDSYTLFAKNGYPDGSWEFDTRTQNLINSQEIKDCIVVAIDTQYRMRTLLPNKPFFSMSPADQGTISTNNGGGPLADEQLAWMINELKPYIDSTYSTLTDHANTVILGASMGGLFAAYAFGERSDVFGRAACVSTHYQGTLLDAEANLLTDDVVSYIQNYFPAPSGSKKVYFDSGTESLDANYLVPQGQVDSIMQGKGYNSTNWKTVIDNGAGHNPTYWGPRLPGILKFLIPR